ncbi:MAG: hypothetical protein QOI64_763 [Solirubrobacteraceae bacterium]|nr:hypothetical protein [Solirubrobacteraceae bacterium]
MPHDVPARRTRAAACLPALVTFVFLYMTATPGLAHAAAADAALDPEERALCEQINRFRAQSGAPALRASIALTKAASWLSFDMAAHDGFDHVDSRGRDFDERITAFGYRSPTMAENIAGGEAGASATFKQLKRSPSLRSNMLRAKLRVIGIGRAPGSGTMLAWYWTTTFGGTLDRSVAC